MLSIVTINYNGSESTIKLLKSLQNQADQDFQIIVVDNASEEADFNNLQTHIWKLNFHISTIRNKENLGFSGGNNVGIREALENGALREASGQAEWVLLLNNDTWVESDFIASIRPVLRQKQGILGLPMDEGKRVSYCGKIRWLKPVGYHIYDYSQAQKDEDKHIIGGGMLIHKDVFEKIGFLDEKYFLYFEDVDYSVRARKAGIPLEILEKPLIHHATSSTTKKLGRPLLMRYHYRNALYFNFKNGPWYIKLLVWPWSGVILLKQAVKVMIYHNREQSLAILNGALDFYKNKMGKI